MCASVSSAVDKLTRGQIACDEGRAWPFPLAYARSRAATTMLDKNYNQAHWGLQSGQEVLAMMKMLTEHVLG